MKIRLFELFAGIGANSKALKNLGIPHELIGYSEIDKYASKAFSVIHGVPEALNFGDITKIDTDKLPDFDLMTWGFPCQDISVAGKQRGIVEGETRSGLYYEGLRILKAKLPKYSIIENVKNLVGKKFKAEFESILQDLEGLGYTNYWKVLNAKDYGIPQNRERVFIVSIRGEHEPYEWPVPFDNGLRLKDMLEDKVDKKYYISQDKVEKLLANLKNNKLGIKPTAQEPTVSSALSSREHRCSGWSNIAGTLCARDYKDPKVVAIPCLTPDRIEKRQNGRRFKEDGEPMFTLTGQDRHGVLCIDPQGRKNKHCIPQETCPTLRAQSHGNEPCVLQKIGSIGSDSQGGNTEPKILEDFYVNRDVREYDDCPTIRADRQGLKVITHSPYVDKKYQEFIDKNGYVPELYRIRKLTPKEGWRLMGFNDADIDKCIDAGISNTQLYKMAGNSIVVNVLEEIYKSMEV